MSNPISRRSFLKAVGACGAVVAAPAIGQGLTKVSFTTAWSPEGLNLFSFVARDKGFWKRYGLDVSIAFGSGSGPAAQAVAANSFMFGVAATPTVIAQAARGLPLTCIGLVNYDVLMGVGVLADSNIMTPKDLEGKKLGTSVGSGEHPFLTLYAQKAGFDLSKTQVVQFDTKVRDRSLAQKLVDGVTGFGTGTIPALASNGVNVRFMLYKDAGLEFYGQSLITQPARVKSDPALCQAFVAGAMEAAKLAMVNPDEGLDIFMKANPELAMSNSSKEYVRIGLGLATQASLVPEVEQHGLGWADPAKVKAMSDMILQYASGQGAKMPNLDELFTNQFAGKLKLSQPEIARIRQNVEPFRKYLA